MIVFTAHDISSCIQVVYKIEMNHSGHGIIFFVLQLTAVLICGFIDAGMVINTSIFMLCVCIYTFLKKRNKRREFLLKLQNISLWRSNTGRPSNSRPPAIGRKRKKTQKKNSLIDGLKPKEGKPDGVVGKPEGVVVGLGRPIRRGGRGRSASGWYGRGWVPNNICYPGYHIYRERVYSVTGHRIVIDPSAHQTPASCGGGSSLDSMEKEMGRRRTETGGPVMAIYGPRGLLK